MSRRLDGGWLEELHSELGLAGIRGRMRRRIELELADHLATEPGSEARLGTPREVAQRFAAELRTGRTRRSTWGAFAALALAAFGLLATTRAYTAAGGWPAVHGANATIVPIAGILILGACQVAFVAGILGLARMLRIGRDAPAADLRLVQRRMGMAVAAAALTALAMLVHAVVLWGLMPWWWDAVALTGSALPLAALAVAATAIGSAHELTPAGGPPAGLEADFPHVLAPLVSRPYLLAVVVGGAATLLALGGGAYAEGSLMEGAVRAAFEGVVFVVCFAALARPLAIRT
jgi:hypothetical protein